MTRPSSSILNVTLKTRNRSQPCVQWSRFSLSYLRRNAYILLSDRHLTVRCLSLPDRIKGFICPPDAQVHPAVQRLQKENGALFKCLQVRVLDLKKWSETDVKCNLNGGSLYPEADRTCPILAEIGDRMAQIRTFASVSAYFITSTALVQLGSFPRKQPVKIARSSALRSSTANI